MTSTKDALACARGPGESTALADYDDLLTVDDVCQVLKISDRTAYRLVEKGELPHVKIGRRLYFPKHMMIDRLQLERSDAK